MDETELEAQAFDDQIKERVKHGHIPDLREVKPCDYFYCNPWRHPELVHIDMGESLQLMLKNAYTHAHLFSERQVLTWVFWMSMAGKSTNFLHFILH